MSSLIELKATSYDVLMEIEELNKKIIELQYKKNELDIKIKTLMDVGIGKTDKTQKEKTDELRIKEQQIIEKRLQRIGKK